MSQIILKKSRQFSAVTLIVGAALLAFFAFANFSRSANPAGGSIGPAGPTITWAGTALGGASLDESTCTQGVNCDSYNLTLSGVPSDWAGKKAHVKISWTGANDDYDVFVHKGSLTGPLVASSAQGGAGPEEVDLDPNVASVGTGLFVVNVVYFTVVAGDEYTGTASVTGGAPTPTPTPSPGSTPTPTPSSVNAPRFQNYVAPPGAGEDSGEPSIGVNYLTENVVRPGSGHTFANSNGTILNGGTVL